MSNELYHYGILGMRWGVRRKGDNYKYTSRWTKRYNRKLKRAIKKGASDEQINALRKMAERSQDLDTKTQKVATDPTTSYRDLMRTVNYAKGYAQTKALMKGKDRGAKALKVQSQLAVAGINPKWYANLERRTYVEGTDVYGKRGKSILDDLLKRGVNRTIVFNNNRYPRYYTQGYTQEYTHRKIV